MTRSFEGEPESQQEQEHKQESAPASQIQQQNATNWQNRLDSFGRYSQDAETTVKAVRVDFGKRLVALIIDMFATYLIAQLTAIIPVLNILVPTFLVLLMTLLIRDHFFAGRGLGKNLMGLQVVDVMTGQPCSLLQSFKRNIVLLGPLLILYIILLMLKLVAVIAHVSLETGVFNAILEVVRTCGSIYTLLVIPYEAYRVYSRADGRRFGDLLAGTAVIEAPMDFSQPLQKQ